MHVCELFDKYDEEYRKFDRIPIAQRLHTVDKICGILKVYQLLNVKNHWSMDAQHDILYLSPLDALDPLTDADVIYLQRCGISYDLENDCLFLYT